MADNEPTTPRMWDGTMAVPGVGWFFVCAVCGAAIFAADYTYADSETDFSLTDRHEKFHLELHTHGPIGLTGATGPMGPPGPPGATSGPTSDEIVRTIESIQQTARRAESSNS